MTGRRHPGGWRRLLLLVLAVAAIGAVAVALAAGGGDDGRGDPRATTAVARIDCGTVLEGRELDAAAHTRSASRPPRLGPGAAGVTPAPRRLRVGLHASVRNYKGRNLCAQIDLARAAGAKWLRENFAWNEIEPRPGRFSWAKVDRVVGAAASRRIRILPIVIGSPGWAASSQLTIPSDPGDYARFVARVVRRYGPNGSFWRARPDLPDRSFTHVEIWNEPYYEFFSEGGSDPGRYARLVKAAVQAGRKANPRVKYIVEANTTGQLEGGRLIDWVPGMFEAVPDLAQYVDVVGVHPYSVMPPNTDPGVGSSPNNKFRRIETIREQFTAAGAGDKPFWITEVGWSTCPANPQDCVTEGEQVTYMKDAFNRVGSQYPWVGAIFLYHLRDFHGNEPANKEQFFGLVRPDGSAKPSLRGFQAFSRAPRPRGE